MCAFGLLVCAAAALASGGKGDGGSLRVNRALRATHSRRECDRLISEGRITVNGVVVNSSDDRLRPGDVVRFDGSAPVPWSDDELGPHRYVKLHKPRGIECTTDRRVEGNIVDYFESLSEVEGGVEGFGGGGDCGDDGDSLRARRVYPVGRLDRESTGLILLTSDGSVVNPLLRSGEEKSKEYLVTTEPPASREDARRLARGVVITAPARRDGEIVDVTARTAPCTVERSGGEGGAPAGIGLRFVLGEGRNRQIRRMCASLGLEVIALHRVSFAGVTLEGCESLGSWVSLTEQEELLIGARRRKKERTPEEVARRKAKKAAKKEKRRTERDGRGLGEWY